MGNKNKELIFEFRDFCFMEGLSKVRVWRETQRLK